MLQEYQWNCTPSCHNSHPRSQLQYQWNEKQVAKLTQLTWFTQQLSYDRVYQRLCYSCSSYVTYLESSDPPDPPPLSLALVLDSHCTALPSWEVNSERTNYSCHSLALACSVSPSFSRVWNDSNMALTPLNLALAYFLKNQNWIITIHRSISRRDWIGFITDTLAQNYNLSNHFPESIY